MRRLTIVLVALGACLLLAGCVLNLQWKLPSHQLLFEPDRLPVATVGQSYLTTVTVTDPATPVGGWSVEPMPDSLPPGLELKQERGRDNVGIGGTPTKAGTYRFKLGAWCLGTNQNGQTGARIYTLTVK